MGEDLDRLTSEASPERRGFSDDYLRGLHASVPAATLLRTMAIRSPSRPPSATWARSSATRAPLCTLLWGASEPYSPECVEGEFWEVCPEGKGRSG